MAADIGREFQGLLDSLLDLFISMFRRLFDKNSGQIILSCQGLYEFGHDNIYTVKIDYDKVQVLPHLAVRNSFMSESNQI